jgi:hypothetical protein
MAANLAPDRADAVLAAVGKPPPDLIFTSDALGEFLPGSVRLLGTVAFNFDD